MTQDELKSRLHYNPETGIFTWLHQESAPKHWNSRYAGKAAGTKLIIGYYQISINKVRFYSHRLAFLYMYGYMPKEIDHIDGNPLNNRIVNLRAVTRKVNMKNLRRNCLNKSGRMGVFWDESRRKWAVSIQSEGKSIYGGRFSDRAAADIRRQELEEMYGFHRNHDRE